MEFLYRGSRDGSKSTDFHSKCDNQGPIITLFKNKNDIYLENMILFHGQVVILGNLLIIVLFLL